LDIEIPYFSLSNFATVYSHILSHTEETSRVLFTISPRSPTHRDMLVPSRCVTYMDTKSRVWPVTSTFPWFLPRLTTVQRLHLLNVFFEYIITLLLTFTTEPLLLLVLRFFSSSASSRPPLLLVLRFFSSCASSRDQLLFPNYNLYFQNAYQTKRTSW
jgi:hypothetical protein